MSEDVPDYMKHNGVVSGWGLLYIFLATISAYSIASSGDVFLFVPRLIKAFNKDDPTKVKGLVYTVTAIVITFPVWGLLPLLSFLIWCASSDYEGASMWFIASLGFFGLLAFLTLKFSGWMPLPVIFYYMVFTCFSFFLFVITQLGIYDEYYYTISGTMSVAVSSIPLIYIALVSGQVAQSRAMKSHHIEGNDTVIYESCIKPTKVTRGYEEHIDKFFEYMENLPLNYLFSGLYILSMFPIFVFAIDAIVSGKTGAGLIALVNIMIIELGGASLYTDIYTPLANVYKLALLSLGTRFIILGTPPGFWLITNFSMLCFASILYWIRFLEVVMPHPGCKMKMAASIMSIFNRRDTLDEHQAANNLEDYNVLDESEIEMSFLDEVQTEVHAPSNNRVEGEVAKTHVPPTPHGLPNSGIAVATLQVFCMINLLLGASNTHGITPDDLIIECKRCKQDIGQYSLCGFVWASSFFTMSLCSIRHLYNQYQQGGHNQRVRQTLLYTIQTLLLSGHESFEVFRYQMDKIALFFMPEVKGHHALGFMILLTYIQAIVMSIVAGWLFNLWFLVPCTTLMPIANYILYRFIKMWEKNGCKHAFLWEQYSSVEKSEQDTTADQDSKEDLGQSVALAEMNASVSCQCIGGWKGNILTVEKVESGWIGINSTLSGMSQASFAAQWSGATLKVAGITQGHLCVGHKIISEVIPAGTIVVSDDGGGVYTVNQDIGEQKLDVNLKSEGAFLADGTKVVKMLSEINKGKGGKYEMSVAPDDDALGQHVEITAESEADFIAKIDGTTMTVQQVTKGHLCVGMEISCIDVIKGTTIKAFGTASDENQIGTYVVEIPSAQKSSISFKFLSPLKAQMIENWVLALFLHLAAVMLSIPTERNEVPWLLSQLFVAIFLSYAAFVRWRVKLQMDKIQIYWILSAWIPLFLFASTAPAFDIDTFLILFIFFGGIGLQLFTLAMLMMSDCNQSATGEKMLEANLSIIWGLIGTSVCTGMIVVSTLMALHSVAAGACLLMISIIPFFIILVHVKIIPLTIYLSRLYVFFAIYVILAVLCGMTGAILNPSYSFYWASFTWAALGIVFLGVGINYDLYGPERVYSYYFFPIYQLSYDGRRLEDATFQGSGILVFLLMLAVWSLWCAVCVDPYPSVVVFVLTFEFIIVYVLVKSRNFDDFSKLLGLDYSALVTAAEYSIRYHACELHELPHDLLDALHIPDGKDVDEKEGDKNSEGKSNEANSKRPTLEYDVEGIMPPSLSPFETIKNIISLKNERYTQYVLREQFEYPISLDEMDEKVNNTINLFDGMVIMNAVLGRVFAMYRLKALVVAESNRRLMEAEILSFIRTNIPDMDHVNPHHLEQIADIEMVNVLLAWKEWKEKRESIRQQFLAIADKLAQEAEIKRHAQMVQQLLKISQESNTDDGAKDEIFISCGESMHVSMTDFKKQMIQNGGYNDNTFMVNGGQKLLESCTDMAGLMKLLDEFCLPQTGVLVDDVVQSYGTLADGYFLSALATIVEKKPKLLLKVFDIESDPMQSIYAVKLYYNGSRHTVIVDDCFPLLPKRIEEISRKLWIMLIKKAYAKLYGSYDSIEGGFESTALADLTGGIPEVLTDLSFNLEKTWGRLTALCSADHLMLAGGCVLEDQDPQTKGSIAEDRSFPILDVREIDGHRVVRVRNLWGQKHEELYRWGQESIEWTPRYKNLLNYNEKYDGTFWIDFTDFCHFFKRVHSCRLFGDRETSGRVSSWSVESAGGCMKYAESFANNPHFLLKGAGVVTIVLSQDEVTNSGVDENETKIIETVAVGIYAFRTGGYPLAPGTLPSFNQLVDKTSFVNERDVILELADVQPGVTYTIIPTTYAPGITRSFTLKAYSKSHVELKPLEKTSDVKLKPLTVDSNLPISVKSRSKPSSPSDHSSFMDIEANNVADVMTTAITDKTTASATISNENINHSDFHEVYLSDDGMDIDSADGNSDATDDNDSEDQHMVNLEEARF